MGKSVFAIPNDKIKQIFVPQDGLKKLMELEKKDPLQSTTIKLIKLLSNYSKITLSDFGIHGSILTSMHSQSSDIDIAVYGADNFRILKKAVMKLKDKGQVKYLYEIPTDYLRMNKGIFEGKKFVFNAIRKISEIKNTYELFEYKSIKQIHFQCKVIDNSQAVFRPAVYKIDNYIALNDNSYVSKELMPCEVVAMIGEYRDVVQNNQITVVSGMLERVKNLKTDKIHHRVVIGSGEGEEFIVPPDEL